MIALGVLNAMTRSQICTITMEGSGLTNHILLPEITVDMRTQLDPVCTFISYTTLCNIIVFSVDPKFHQSGICWKLG